MAFCEQDPGEGSGLPPLLVARIASPPAATQLQTGRMLGCGQRCTCVTLGTWRFIFLARPLRAVLKPRVSVTDTIAPRGPRALAPAPSAPAIGPEPARERSEEGRGLSAWSP